MKENSAEEQNFKNFQVISLIQINKYILWQQYFKIFESLHQR